MNGFYEQYITYKTQIDGKLFSFIDKEYPKSVYEPLKYLLSGGGKRIRPMMLILSCEALGGTFDKSIHAALAIEVLHNFTLVHDDIMDNADTRRGRETIHKKWNTNIAILAGDEMIGLAYKSLLKTKTDRIGEIANVFTEGMIEVCEGQGFDKEFEERTDVKLEEYIMMIAKKTSRLLETCAVIGALIGDGTPTQIDAMRSYANNIGLAFQIQDDLLDITADELQFGKKIGGDVVEGKKTYLLLKALEVVHDPAHREKLMRIVSGNELRPQSDEEILEIKNIYEIYGILNAAQKEIEHYTNEADKYLAELPETHAKKMLGWFSRMLLDRNF